MMCVQPWPRSTLSKTNKTVLKVHGFGSGRKIKSINFLAEVELNVFFPVSLGKTEERIYVLPENQAEFVESFPKAMHPWEKILLWRNVWFFPSENVFC